MPESSDPPHEQLIQAADLAGLAFTPAECEMALPSVMANRNHYTALRSVQLPNDLPPAITFDPDPQPASFARVATYPMVAATSLSDPRDEAALVFASIPQLAILLRTGAVTSRRLTELALDRLRRFDASLHCVVTMLDERALHAADVADRELQDGNDRGTLHGIPWGAKDLIAVAGAPTTWGSPLFREQQFDNDASVVRRLDDAGAILVAKLSVGELAWGDVWYGGMTRTPWNLEKGSSGSSAGSGAAVAAGLVPFALGTETWGSIISPATQCGVTGLRPSFGRVSREGVMALAWTMDKVGPMCRSAEDCALVLAAIAGPDGLDPTACGHPLDWPRRASLDDIRIGVVESAFAEERPHQSSDTATLDVLRALGATLVPIALPDLPIEALAIILEAETASQFDELTRSGRDEEMVRQVADAWPNLWRRARLIPAVEYLQAQRVRTMAIRAMHELMATIDCYICPTFGANNLLLTNLTGHPQLAIPNGFDSDECPASIVLTGRLFDEGMIVEVARHYQRATDFHARRPPLSGPDA